MKVYALLSWYAENPAHLRRCVTSLKGFADMLVACDGAYKTFPGRAPGSSQAEHWAIYSAASAAGMRVGMHHAPRERWASEVAKRAEMFEFARRCGATPQDWLLIIDGDMELAAFTPEARELLAATGCDTAEVRWHDVQIDGKPSSTHRFRSMFRAVPGLTVEKAHYLYTVPTDRGRRFLWHIPSGHISDEPFLDLSDAVTLHHHNSSRDPERRKRALRYYEARDAAGLEAVGDFA